MEVNITRMKMRMTLPAAAAVILLLLAKSSYASQCAARDGGKDLSCRMRTLQSGLHQADVQVGLAKSLRLACSDLFFAESHLRSEHFGHLPQLEALSIDRCKLRRVPARAFVGLTSLKRLAVRSRNSDWSSTVLEADAHAMDNMDRLEELDFSANNLWTLPRGFFCQMPKLRSANLSANQLLEVSDLGLSILDGGCQVQLHELDLSSNQLSTMRRGDVAATAASLQVLNLSDNRLTICGEEMLHGMHELRRLSLADNRLAALPMSLFNTSGQMTELSLQNNSLALLPAGLFRGLDSLVLLNLSQNAISTHLLSKATFSGLPSLQVLDLSHNQLTKIESDVFSQLPALKLLRLQHNSIHTLAPNSFAFLSGLELIGLSHNKLSALPSGALAGLRSLTSLSLDHNEIGALPDDLFGDTPKLEDLSLENNRLESVPNSISLHARKLRTLDLGENQIAALAPGDFDALPELYGLRVSGNGLTALTASNFANATRLHVLNLARNKLANIEQGSFAGLVELRALRLDNNVLTDINGLVSSLDKLKWLNVSSNQLQWFDYAFVPMSLEWLDLHDNQIEELGNYYKLREGFSLKTLDVSKNAVNGLGPLSLPTSLETVLLAGNRIKEVPKGQFEDKVALQRVDLSDNGIVRLHEDSLLVSSKISSDGELSCSTLTGLSCSYGCL
jgi:Leucine-rich repeat (LRR) protein